MASAWIIGRNLAVALLSLMLLAGSASAECAWVRWTEREIMSTVYAWKKNVSFDRKMYETRKACEAALIEWMEWQVKVEADAGARVFRRGARGDEGRPADFQGSFWRIDIPMRQITEVHRKDGGNVGEWTTVSQYSCLPDTLDPRGPKGEVK